MAEFVEFKMVLTTKVFVDRISVAANQTLEQLLEEDKKYYEQDPFCFLESTDGPNGTCNVSYEIKDDGEVIIDDLSGKQEEMLKEIAGGEGE